MLCLLSGPPGFTCLISFAPVFSCTVESLSLFYLFLYLGLYVLRDDSWINANQTSMCLELHQN